MKMIFIIIIIAMVVTPSFAISANSIMNQTTSDEVSLVNSSGILSSIKARLGKEFDKSNREVDKYVNENLSDNYNLIGRSSKATSDNINNEKSLRGSEPLTASTTDIIINGLSIRSSNGIGKYNKINVISGEWYKQDSRTFIAAERLNDNKYVRYYTMSIIDDTNRTQFNKYIKQIFGKLSKKPSKTILIIDVIPGDSSQQMIHAKEIAVMAIDTGGNILAYKVLARSKFIPENYSDESAILNPFEASIRKSSSDVTLKESTQVISINKMLPMLDSNKYWVTCNGIKEHTKEGVIVRGSDNYIFDVDKHVVLDQERLDKLFSLVTTDDAFYLENNRNDRFGYKKISISKATGQLKGTVSTSNPKIRNKLTGSCQANP